ncbi:hypothetical protein I2I11_09150 [Pontibacter sp. 172403-2]|uniref:hypothetical protein n=1 Tax=Pontibacter rufus TaxID=2791028 RepID=UPI0018AFFDE6|nr:hypothetical protein [Pontibacter sp. 172403-2]MBF9253456.1 hypothetical protein [Pontibacter sp. 172403-2]
MSAIKEFTGTTEAEIWQKVAEDIAAHKAVLKYTALLHQSGQQILFDLDIDLGGGFESGISTTTFRAAVPARVPLRFHLHEQDFLGEISKVLGMEDVKVGYPDFDAAFIIKTNQPDTLRKLFADESVRRILLRHTTGRLKLEAEDGSPDAILSFKKDEAIVEVTVLREIYHVLRVILERVSL